MSEIRSSKEFTKSIIDMTREEIENVINTRNVKIIPEEQECVIGMCAAEDFARIDMCIRRNTIKYIMNYNKICKSGLGEVTYWDDTHVCYKINIESINPFALRHAKEMTPEQKESLAERAKDLSKFKKSKTAQATT